MLGYDYAQEGLYFLTLCCHHRQCLFGTVVDRQVVLNDFGKVADACWLQIPNHFPHARLHEYVVMPNHVHGIIEIVQHPATMGDNEPVNITTYKANAFRQMIPKSISAIVKGYKIGVTKWFREHGAARAGLGDARIGAENFLPQQSNDHHPMTVWQRNFYEHIIRNDADYLRIAEYICNNPQNWKDDTLHPSCHS